MFSAFGQSKWWYIFIYLAGAQFAMPLLFNIWLSIYLGVYENTYVHAFAAAWALITLIVGIWKSIQLLAIYTIFQAALAFRLAYAFVPVAPPAFDCFFNGCNGAFEAWGWNLYFLTLLTETGFNFLLMLIPVFIFQDRTDKKQLVRKKLGQEIDA